MMTKNYVGMPDEGLLACPNVRSDAGMGVSDRSHAHRWPAPCGFGSKFSTRVRGNGVVVGWAQVTSTVPAQSPDWGEIMLGSD